MYSRGFDWTSLLAGVVLVLGGIYAVSNPSATFATLAVLIGVVALAAGAMFVFAYYRDRGHASLRIKLGLALGVALLVVGLLFVASPATVSGILAYAVAVWFIVDAINNLINSRLVREFDERLYVANLVLSVLLLIGGFVLLLHPAIVGISIGLVAGLCLLVSGAGYILLSFVKRRIR